MTIDLEELAQKKKFEDLMAERENTSEQVTTAFLVVQGTDGQWTAYSEYMDKDLSLLRSASMDDIVGGCSNVVMGCQIQQSAVATMITMEQRAMQMQHQMRQQQEAQQALSLIDPSKLRA